MELRDSIMPQYQAQLDEFAQKMALRFDAQGMPLFVDRDGSVPSQDDVAGSYLGFAARVQVNPKAENPEFVRYGGQPALDPATNELVTNQRVLKVLNYAFGSAANAARGNSIIVPT